MTDNSILTLIPIYAPRLWWRIHPFHVQNLVPEDPDVLDHGGTYRHADRDEHNWSHIAEAVSRVADVIATQDWTIDDDVPAYGYANVNLENLNLTRIELKIVKSWFSAGQGVQSDPWFDLQNGRHRLWLTKDFFGAERIPVMGSEILYATPEDAEALGPNWTRVYEANLRELKQVDWFDSHDLVNQRFVEAIRTAAAGKFPAQR